MIGNDHEVWVVGDLISQSLRSACGPLWSSRLLTGVALRVFNTLPLNHHAVDELIRQVAD